MKRNFLDCVPVRLDKSEEMNGVCCIIHENTGFFNLLAQRLFRRPRRSYVSLDEYGGFIWNAIDGERSVYDIAVMFERKFERGSVKLTAQFIAALKRNGFIGYSR